MKWLQVYAMAWLVTAALSAVATLVGRRIAPGLGFVDSPMKEKHKRHGREVPVLGGAAMLLAWLVVIAAGLLISSTCQRLLSPRLAVYLPGIQTVLPQLVWIVGGAVAMVGLGLADDRWALGAFTKFAGQFCVAGAVACYGVRVTIFWSHPVITWGITTFWILLIINALNFFDNMDGLAAGTAAIAAFLFAFAAGIRGQYFVAVLAAVTCGTASGFLLHNRPPASIFMGDAGSHFLGYVLAVLGSLTTYYTPAESPTPAPILIPLFILGLPIFDAFAVVVMRLYRGQPIYVGDHTHISHRFTRLGMSRSQAVLLVYLLNFTIGAAAISLLWLPLAGTVMVFLQALAVLTAISLIQYFGSPGKKEQPC
ncbi:MAG: undecaprenyl/decaprenyl-phosphate alpha-N-acetylglucosaminyl 1-phosphate transferase [Lentisphaerae bacterium]|jgi:UDP-GlcNAc:undecaprenyl-phosphate/decaprenyl-phosphate GlcNAc-1-phosphate transferase|nr:undecaprenyl/decaprenyl-phosphate alpha-N-acetylglucosaminyl 1-phosphate transferase [Lentisphaerota bacterium]MBT4819756.1 undecaprenyl/decaprenyl-phosphate alpha-N-acetylglucosaminyl 1-phosphate transferase [Lentisphaerota bacterium]MBT5608290.1 undecaprenyl/decaprenyl-phosphate alpha-N-acetylglucosaminyl 1-phosphate transferase [Lentisphaerota bacterium]MBT7061810.1 undecaprenyl/decaprenyl-phosphate alpha-N-acetylglucosaminyl 1-phosphate transferase [Lentisphaerota bacterium]MBT7846119.1 